VLSDKLKFPRFFPSAPLTWITIAMTDGESCPGGGAECNYSEMHELSLVEKVMRAIEEYNKDRHTDPCPLCLRDAMLAVAALLHMEAARPGGASSLLGEPEVLEEEFGEAAREKLRAVAEAVAASPIGLRQ
jgi:hypothetical protein